MYSSVTYGTIRLVLGLYKARVHHTHAGSTVDGKQNLLFKVLLQSVVFPQRAVVVKSFELLESGLVVVPWAGMSPPTRRW